MGGETQCLLTSVLQTLRNLSMSSGTHCLLGFLSSLQVSGRLALRGRIASDSYTCLNPGFADFRAMLYLKVLAKSWVA